MPIQTRSKTKGTALSADQAKTATECSGSQSSQQAKLRAEHARLAAELEKQAEEATLRRIAAESAAAQAELDAKIAEIYGSCSHRYSRASERTTADRTQVWVEQAACYSKDALDPGMHQGIHDRSSHSVVPPPMLAPDGPTMLSDAALATWTQFHPVAPAQHGGAAQPRPSRVTAAPFTTRAPPTFAYHTGTLGAPAPHDNTQNKTNPTPITHHDILTPKPITHYDIMALADAIVGAQRQQPRHRKISDIKLPSFSGLAAEWLPFKKTYDRTEAYYDPIENISRILSALTGSARDAVATLAAASDDPRDVLRELELRFGRPETVVRQLVADLSALPRLSHATSDSDECSDLYHAATSERAAKSSAASSSDRRTELKCLYCKASGHKVDDCKQFLVLPTDQRWRWATENKICRKCLKKGSHRYALCKVACKVPDCKRRHHTLLHDSNVANLTTAHAVEASTPLPPPQEPPQIDTERPVTVAHNAEGSCNPSLRPLLKVVPVTIFGPKRSIETFALLDDGSTVTLVDQSIAVAVGAEGPTSTVHINCVGGLSKRTNVTFVDLEVQGRNSSNRHSLRNVRAISELGITAQSVSKCEISDLPYLSDIMQEITYEFARPMMIIGIDNWHLTIPQMVRRGSRSQPVAALTSFGWVLFGCLSDKTELATLSLNHVSTKEEADIDTLIREHHDLDSIGISKKTFLCPNDQYALDTLNRTTRRLDSGRFETGLLWKPNLGRVPSVSSYKLALSRFLNIEKKFSRDEDYRQAYAKNVESTIEKGYAEECTDPPNPNGVTWYLPHFGVVHPQKKKLRVVHDAAAKCEGVSLNSLLLPGPDLLQPLLGILMKFREGKVALNGDIREMFPQIRIIPEDRDAQRFLWRSDPSKPIKQYRMASMMFGATCSPCIAISLKNKNAEDYRSAYPEAADAILYNHYMNDLLISVDSEEEAAKLAADIVEVHSKACFEMRSWVSNSKKALSLLPPHLCADGVSPIGLTNSNLSVRVLGMAWNVGDDTLVFSRALSEGQPTLTKRVILSQLMRVYDPLGLLCPITIKGRILFQKVWKLKIDWDSELPSSVISAWSDWCVELQDIASCAIPRPYHCLTHSVQVQLHVFADASPSAYATVAYWRFYSNDKSVHVSLIGGKARLAPLKVVSIPRLELQAALIASRFASYIVEHHKLKPESVTFWSDSLTVLKWLRSDSATFKAFVAHRISEVRETTNVASWKYVPSAMNVADDATKANSKFHIRSRWFLGPDFLKLDPCKWPIETPAEVSLPARETHEADVVVAATVVFPSELLSPVVADHSRFSVWLRLIRATARAHAAAQTFLKLLHSCRSRRSNLNHTGNPPPLTAAVVKSAENHLLRPSQLDSLEVFVKNSQLQRFQQEIGEDGLLRLSSRICNAKDIPPTRDLSPIILNGHHHITELLVAHYHRMFAHGNTETVVNELRRKYFITPLRPTVKRISSKCLICKIRRSVPVVPPFGNLPEARLAHHTRPFSYVGLDYFGPLNVTAGRRSLKRYVALFTCLTVRAIHLEVVESLSLDSAIMALKRFIARRGCPLEIYSDNGTAFVGAARQLDNLFDFAANRKIVWKFIPPAAPFMGGSWERLVRSIKTSLKATLNERSPREEVLATLLAEVESMVNSRPLTHVPVDPDSEEALTPFHFLLGAPNIEPPNKTLDEADLFRRSEWRKGLRLADHFWSRWIREVLPVLAPRRGGTKPTLKVGDMVVIVDASLPRGSWPRGRVTRTWPGPDGVTRVVEVATQAGTLKRAARLVFQLPT